MHRDASRTLPVLWTVVLAGLVLFLALHNLSYYPPTWYDEGVHLLVARKLATEGRYLFGPALGPTVFFPVAAAFRVAGTELLPARTVMAGYLLLFVAAFYALSYQLGGWKVATVATLILISSPGTYLVRYGRQVLGEVPAALFFLLGILVWLKALEGGRGLTRFTKLVFGGLLLGLSILTKNQFVLLLPAWFLVGVAGRLYHRETRLSTTVAPVVGALVCVASWYLVQRFCFPYGERLASQNVQEWSDALDRGVLTFSPGRMLEAVKFLTSQDAIYAWALPGCAYAGVLSLRRSKAGLRWALLAVVSAVWLAWFVAFSVAWPRYAFLPLTVCTLFVAQLFHDLTDGYRAPLQDFWKTARSGR